MSKTYLENNMIDSLDASKITGTIGNGCIPAVLPAVDGSALTGISGGTGKILQVVETTWAAERMNNSNQSWQVAGLEGTITPSSTSSKVLIYASFTCLTSQAAKRTGYTIFRNNTAAVSSNANGSELSGNFFGMAITRNSDNGNNVRMPVLLNYLDSPATTNATTYHLASKCIDTGFQHYICSGNVVSVMILMEIEG